MAVSGINVEKEKAVSAAPVLLADITFYGGVTRYYASQAVTFGGNTYVARVANQEIAAAQAMGESGIDVPATVNLRLADPDYWVWNNDEMGAGFRGSEVLLRLVFFEPTTGEVSSDARVVFRGVCREPGGRHASHDGQYLTVGYISRLAISEVTLPTIRIQKTCPWVFPRTLAERQAGADDLSSDFRRCGYSPDATGSNARGNLNGSVPYTSCDFTKTACVARGMYTKDSANRQTGRFGGFQWTPPTESRVRGFVSRKWELVSNVGNEAVYGGRVPFLFGTARIDPLVMNSLADGNYTRGEVLLHFDRSDYIYEVRVNGYYVPHTFDDSLFPEVPPGVANRTEALKIGWWKTTNRGGRDGAPTNDAGFNDSAGVPQGDPYGSYAVIEVVVPSKIAPPGSRPEVQVVCKRGASNPATHVAEIMQEWAAWGAARVDSASLAAAEAHCAHTITSGGEVRPRLAASLYVKNPESAADIVRSFRTAGRLIVGVGQDGKLKIGVRSTLAWQQPAPVPGSNYNTAIASKLPESAGIADGTAADGYPAYKFDYSNVTSIKPSIKAAGNIYSAVFGNAANNYSQDAYTGVDTEDLVRVQVEAQASTNYRAVMHYSGVRSLVATAAAEATAGNPRGNGGSIVVELETTTRAAHLSPGDIVLIHWPIIGVDNQLFRLERVEPSADFQRCKVVASWHVDDWYLVQFAGVTAPEKSPRDRFKRPAYAWQPGLEAPATLDAVFDETDLSFSLSQRYDAGASGPLAKIRISGLVPVNDVVMHPAPPAVPLQGVTASTGGTIEGDRVIYLALVALDSADKLGFPSRVVPVSLAPGSTNTAGVADIVWSPGTVKYEIYAGADPNRLAFQGGGTGTPSSVSISSLDVSSRGLPDTEFDFLRVRAWRDWHAGVWGAEVASVTSTTITVGVPSPGFTANEWAGYTLTWLGRDDADPLEICNWTVTANTADTLTVSGPDVASAGLTIGDAVVLRSLPSWGSDAGGTYIQDVGWTNPFFPSGLTPGEEIGRVVKVYAGTGNGLELAVLDNTAEKLYVKSPIALNSTSRYVVLHSAPAAVVDSIRFNNSDPAAVVDIDVDLPNDEGQSYFVQVFTVDGGGAESLESTSPHREIYLYGRRPAGGFSSAIKLDVPGELAVGSDLSSLVEVSEPTVVKGIKAIVKQAPIGSAVSVRLLVGGSIFAELDIPNGATEAELSSAEVSVLPAIGAAENIRLDLLAVGTAAPPAVSYSGADLVVLIYI